MRVLVRLLLAGAIALVSCASAAAGDPNDWLIGKWEMTFDPDGDQKDWLVFSADGSAVSISPKGRRLPCKYSVTGDDVVLACAYKEMVIPLTLNIASDHSKLLSKSKKTGNSSQYQRVPDGS